MNGDSGSDMTIDLLEPLASPEEMEGSAAFLQGSPLPTLSVTNSWR